MALASDAHNILKSFSIDPDTGKENAGIAISVELIRRLIENSFRSISTQAVGLVSNETFQVGADRYPIAFDAALDSTNALISFDEIPDPVSGSVMPVLRSKKISVELDVSVALEDGSQKDSVGKITIKFKEITTALLLDELDIQLSLLGTSQSGSVDALWRTDPVLKEKLENTYSFVEDDFTRLTEFLNAVRLLIPAEIAKAYVDSIEFPDVFALFPGIVFEGAGRIGAEKDFLLFSADTRLNFNSCPISPTEGTVTTETDPATSRVFVPASSPSRTFPRDSMGDEFNNEATSIGQVFLFAPKKLFEVNFEGIAQPSVGFSDGGRKGIFRWGYSLSLMLESFALSLTGRALEFKIDIDLGGLGYGDAGVKIGSVYYRVAGVAFRGRVSPLQILFRIGFDFPRREVVLYSRIEKAVAKDFNFMTNARWPLSAIAEYLLEKAAKKALKSQAGKILTSTRIPIARWGVLDEVAQLSNALAFHEDGQRDSVTFGANLDL